MMMRAVSDIVLRGASVEEAYKLIKE